MNLGISPVCNSTYNSRNTSFGAIKYTKGAIEKAKNLALDSNTLFLDKCKNFDKGVLGKIDGPRAVVYSVLGALGLRVAVVDTQANGPVKNHTFKVRVNEDNPFKEAEDYANNLIEANDYFGNVQIATKDDFKPGFPEQNTEEE